MSPAWTCASGRSCRSHGYFFLLGYARDSRWWRDEDVDVADSPDLMPAAAEAFARQADRAVSQGLLQSYRVTEESSTVLRGRLREADQICERFGLAIPMEVRFDDYSADIAENQLLRSGAERLLRMPAVPTVVVVVSVSTRHGPGVTGRIPVNVATPEVSGGCGGRSGEG